MPKRTDQKLIRLLRETEKLLFRDIRLLGSHCKVGQLRKGELPSRAAQNVHFTIQIDLNKQCAVVRADFKLIVTYDGSEDSDPPLILSASFGVRYDFSEPASRKHIQGAVERAVLGNTWLYWRELVQFLTVRMGLPAFPVPLMPPEMERERDVGKPKTE